MTLSAYKAIFRHHGYNLLFKLDKGNSIKCFYALESLSDKRKTDYKQSTLKEVNHDLMLLINKIKVGGI